MIVSHPSWLFSILRKTIQAGILRCGYGILLTSLPTRLWGGDHLQVETEVGKMVFSVRDTGCFGPLLWGSIPQEFRETALIRSLAQDCEVMLDIGAHVGWYARVMWQAIKKTGHIFAFEPNPHTFSYLMENVRKRPGLEAYPIAISDRKGQIVFYCAKMSDLSSASRQVGSQVTVEGETVDSFTKLHDLTDKIDFIKCDVEGGELAVLRGAREIRSSRNPPIWMIEVIEAYIVEAGNSVDELMKEFTWGSTRYRLFYLGANGCPCEINQLSERLGTNNIFIVPETRWDQFKKAGEAMNPV